MCWIWWQLRGDESQGDIDIYWLSRQDRMGSESLSLASEGRENSYFVVVWGNFAINWTRRQLRKFSGRLSGSFCCSVGMKKRVKLGLRWISFESKQEGGESPGVEKKKSGVNICHSVAFISTYLWKKTERWLVVGGWLASWLHYIEEPWRDETRRR